jgi:hypothetical protein
VADDLHRLCFTTSTDGLGWTAGAPLRGGAPIIEPTGVPLPQADPWGVAPRLLRLPNGLLALTTGRPGLMLWLAADPPSGEKDAELAQKLGQRRPFIAVFPPECRGQLASSGLT